MFFKKKIKPETIDTVIGEKAYIEGKIRSEASIEIFGKCKGEIEGKGMITVGENSEIESNVHAHQVAVHGHVQGYIETKGQLTIHASGKLTGDINAGSFMIEEGGIFQGESKLNK